MTQQEVRNLIAFIIHAWPTVPFRNDDPVPLIQSWHLILGDVDYRAAQAVLVDVARQGSEFPPAPGVLARTVLDAVDRASGRMAPDVDEAWAIVQDAIHRKGLTHGPPMVWPHPAIETAVYAIGWRELCTSTNVDTLRAHFRQFYERAAERDLRERRSERTAAAIGASKMDALDSGPVSSRSV